MSNYIASPTPITPPRVPFIDARTGLIDRSWYMFFLSLFSNVQNLDDLRKGPDPNSLLASYDAALQTLAQATQTQPSSAELVNQIAELQKQIQSLQIAPPPREFKRSRYGSFFDTTTQTAGTVNTAKAITFNSTDLSRGVYLGTPTSRVYVDTEGVYDFQTSIQLDSSVSTDEHFYLWIAINGTDVPDSASAVRLKGNNSESILALNFFLELNAGDYVEFYFSVTNLGVVAQYVAATPPVPAIPSIILTVSNNIQGVQ